ncbi:MAG: hypothetical protein J7L23_05480 [Candidatus Diapherotrites archaeon]|nr:hypothetical protein [Candidatus Diapherotrites archaeon]
MQNYDCVRCKGTKMLCGKPYCPKVEKAKSLARTLKVSKTMQAPSPTVFVGRAGWPHVQAGAMLTNYEPEGADKPEEWFGKPLSALVDLRSQLVRTKEKFSVVSAMNPGGYDLIRVQEIAMSSKSVDTEVIFNKEPSFSVESFSDLSPPYGPSGEIKGIRLTENPKIPRKIDEVVTDDLKAVSGELKLYKGGTPVSKISKLLSIGLLGEKKSKKLVPTRWSITATDDMIGKKLMKDIKDFEELGDYQLFSSTYLGNHFEVLLVPGKWLFENIEAYIPGNIWLDKDQPLKVISDWEPYSGRTTYASNVTGAYYAARLAVLEYLKNLKRQAGVIVLREITPDYWYPVGVWQIRENVRAAMKTKPIVFNTLREALEEVETRCHVKRVWEKESRVLELLRSREILRAYMGTIKD